MEKLASIEWEIAKGYIFLDRTAHPKDTMLTEQEFDNLINSTTGFDPITNQFIDWKRHNHLYVNEFLINNGYELTHDNMVNVPNLAVNMELQNQKTALPDVPELDAKAVELLQQLEKIYEAKQNIKSDPAKAEEITAQALQAITDVTVPLEK